MASQDTCYMAPPIPVQQHAWPLVGVAGSATIEQNCQNRLRLAIYNYDIGGDDEERS